MKNLLLFFLLLFSLSMACSCGGDSENAAAEGSSSSVNDDRNKSEGSASDGSKASSSSGVADAASMKEAMKEAQKAMGEAGLAQNVKTVNFRELQKMTPEKLAGMERTSKSGQTAGAIGMNISTAEAKYKDRDGTVYEIKLVDTGGLGMGGMSMAAWAMADIDKEDDNGYERTGKLEGYKSYEKFSSRSNRCEVSVFAHERYVITGECKECDMDKLKSVIKEMKIDEMKHLKAAEDDQ